VRSPEKVKRTLKELEATLEREKADSAPLEKKFRGLEVRSTAVGKIDKDLENLESAVVTVTAHKERVKSFTAKAAEQRAELNALRAGQRDVAMDRDHQLALLHNMEESLARYDANIRANTDKAREELGKTKAANARQLEDAADVDREVQENEERIMSLEKHLSDTTHEIEAAMTAMRRMYDEVVAVVRQHSTQMCSALEAQPGVELPGH